MLGWALLLSVLGIAAQPPPDAPVSSGVAVAPGVDPAAGDVTAQPADEVSEIVVQAPEPRYAAPTLRDRIGRVWVPAVINGRGPYRLVLDTGATHSAVVAQVASSLGIPIPTSATIHITGVTGAADVPAIAVKSIDVGELSMDEAVLPIVADVFGGAQGVLGTEGLANKRIFIDFKHDRVAITRSRGELDKHGFATLPLRKLHYHLLALDVLVGGVWTKAVVDTGAEVTIGNAALRAALERRGLTNTVKREIEGVTLDVAHGDLIRAPPISMGPIKFSGVAITYGDMYVFGRWGLTRDPTLVLGMDVLGTVEVLVIDYRLHELQIRLRDS